MSASWAATVRLVEQRAEERCEYCRMHQALQGATFHVDHTLPSATGGSDNPLNLAWSCPRCNLKKAKRTEAVDPITGETVPFFNPRLDNWDDHFQWVGYEIVGLTPKGRALVPALELNHPRRLMIRKAEELFGLFPPE